MKCQVFSVFKDITGPTDVPTSFGKNAQSCQIMNFLLRIGTIKEKEVFTLLEAKIALLLCFVSRLLCGAKKLENRISLSVSD